MQVYVRGLVYEEPDQRLRRRTVSLPDETSLGIRGAVLSEAVSDFKLLENTRRPHENDTTVGDTRTKIYGTQLHNGNKNTAEDTVRYLQFLSSATSITPTLFILNGYQIQRRQRGRRRQQLVLISYLTLVVFSYLNLYYLILS